MGENTLIMGSPSKREIEKSLNLEQQKTHKQQHKWSQGWIDPHLVIRFPQVRKTFEKGLIQELADDIALNDLMQPSMVAKLSLEQFKEYAHVFEKISGTKFMTEALPFETERGARWYYVLVAGERRYRAHMVLWNEGCSDCKRKAETRGRELKKGECFKKHFPKGLMEVRIGLNINPESAKRDQFRENNHVRPPAHEEAYAFRDYYDYLKVLRPSLTLSDFARKVGTSVEKVRRAIWFCELPPKLREAVEKKLISYGNAIELKKVLQSQNGIPDERKAQIVDREIDYLLLYPKIKNEEYKKRVDSIVGSFQMATLFDTEPFEMSKKEKRKVVAEELIKGMTIQDAYVGKVHLLQSYGVIGKGKRFSGISPTRQIKNMFKKLQEIVPGFTLTKAQLKKLNFNLDK